jgi:threonine dehydratase
VNIQDIYAAQALLKPYLSKTPLLFSHLLEKEAKKQVWLKLETQQPTGSFKPRPAFHSILRHLEEARQHGVIASSSGNFAQGVAYAASQLNIDAMIVMTQRTSPFKIQRTKAYGAEVVFCGNSHEERLQTTRDLQQKTGRLLLQPYDSLDTIIGDGTIGLELAEDLGDELNHEMSVLVPVGGGGLIAGIAFTLKTLYPDCKIIGVQSKANASLAKSLEAGKPINVGLIQTIADALVASSPGETPFPIIQKYIEKVILVEEKEIEQATHFMLEQHKLVVEPGGAVGIAALLSGQVTTPRCVCIISGGNIPV